MNKGAINYIARLLAERFIAAGLFLIAAGSFDLRSGIFFAVYIMVAIISATLKEEK